MPRALADHSNETLNRYARKVFDGATRLYRGYPNNTTMDVLVKSARALQLASNLIYGFSSIRGPVATEINESLAALNTIRSAMGDTPVTL